MCAPTPRFSCPKRLSRGFSLVELLVVIGIIAFLIGMLMPSLHRAREEAKAIDCAAHLRQIDTALMMYANSFRGYYPGWSGWHVTGGDGTGEDDPGLGWTESVTPYLGSAPNSRIYNCPSFPEEFRINYFLSARYSNLIGRHNLLFSDIRLASEFIISGDCTQPMLYPPSFGTAFGQMFDDCDKDDATQAGILWAGEGGGGINVHRGGNNVLFADHHIQIFPKFDPNQMTYHPTKMRSYATIGIDP